jgi:hypothetical protein
MKRAFIILAFLAVTCISYAQGGYLRIGYCANHYNMKNYNAMIDRYNVTRPWLDQKMPHMSWMFGPEIAFGGRVESTGGEIYYRSAWGTVQASGSPTSGAPVATRYLRAKDTYFGVEGFVRIIGRVAISIAAEASMFKTKTKVDDGDYEITDKKMSVAFTPGIKVFLSKGFFVPVIQFYYTLPLIREDHSGAWYTLDASNAASEPSENFRARATHFGVSISFALGECED